VKRKRKSRTVCSAEIRRLGTEFSAKLAEMLQRDAKQNKPTKSERHTLCVQRPPAVANANGKWRRSRCANPFALAARNWLVAMDGCFVITSIFRFFSRLPMAVRNTGETLKTVGSDK